MPPGAKVYCGARDGRLFRTQGRNADAAAGPGRFDLFARRGPAAARRQTAADPSQRLDDDATPRSPVPTRTARAGCASSARGSGASATARRRRFPCRRGARSDALSRPANSRRATRSRRVIRGGWQLAGGHGAIDRDRAVDDLVAAFDAGVSTFDCADIYTGVEELYGALRARLSRRAAASAARPPTRAHQACARSFDSARAIARRHRGDRRPLATARSTSTRLDLVQFHWWDYAAAALARGAAAGSMICGAPARCGCRRHQFRHGHVGAILAAGIPLASMQVQYSRARSPAGERLCRALSRARRRPALLRLGRRRLSVRSLARRCRSRRAPLANRSLVKYKLIIDDFGGWALFQELVARPAPRRRPARRRHRQRRQPTVLDRPGVAAVIVGATSRAHLAANVAAVGLSLTDADRAEIEAVARRRRGARRRRLRTGARPLRPAWRDHEIQSQRRARREAGSEGRAQRGQRRVLDGGGCMEARSSDDRRRRWRSRWGSAARRARTIARSRSAW